MADDELRALAEKMAKAGVPNNKLAGFFADACAQVAIDHYAPTLARLMDAARQAERDRFRAAIDNARISLALYGPDMSAEWVEGFTAALDASERVAMSILQPVAESATLSE